MEWTTVLATMVGGAVSIATAWLANRTQFKRDREARAAAERQDRTEYARRKRQDLDEVVLQEIHSIIDAVTNAQRITQLVLARDGDSQMRDFHEDLLLRESHELADGYAKASASSRRLFLIDRHLGHLAHIVSEELNPPEPVVQSSPIKTDMDNLIEASRSFLESPTTVIERS